MKPYTITIELNYFQLKQQRTSYDRCVSSNMLRDNGMWDIGVNFKWVLTSKCPQIISPEWVPHLASRSMRADMIKHRERTAVCAVICVHPTIFAPFKGLSP